MKETTTKFLIATAVLVSPVMGTALDVSAGQPAFVQAHTASADVQQNRAVSASEDTYLSLRTAKKASDLRLQEPGEYTVSGVSSLCVKCVA
ncbi:hypothetical protein [Paenibacillus chitinolyticus]|uniref:hypothetical protein n=1 Tax=Paenibacillus TaxID=44249 RepID=UPI001C45322B|nr:hypothetical protein [Paenibacillus chitinolyticus]MBV6713642.1 hypothetical protein [Paenibacillus chitinolyticus]